MKKVAIITPTLWDKDQLARTAVRGKYDLRYFGDDLFENLSSLSALTFDIDVFCNDTARQAHAWGADGIVGTLDYPGALIAAAVAETLGLPTPSLRSLLQLSHKYYSRLLQRKVAPEAVPPFWSLDPTKPEAPPHFPVFVKPVKGTLSAFAREVADQEALATMLNFSEAQAQLFAFAMKPMNTLLSRFPEFSLSANHFIAEGVLTGDLFTAEGFVARGKMQRLGIVDSIFYPGTRSFERFVYPSLLPVRTQEQMWTIAERVIRAAGFDNGVFDLELIYDASTDRVAIIEVNPRACPQFSDLYEKVDGRNSYDVLLALATGEPLPEPAAGAHRLAASCVLRTFADVTVKKLPSPEALAALHARHPEARIVVLCQENQPLSSQLQDEGSFRYAAINIGAADSAELERTLSAIKNALGITFA